MLYADLTFAVPSWISEKLFTSKSCAVGIRRGWGHSGPETRNGSFPQLLISLPTRWPISLPVSRWQEDFFPTRNSALRRDPGRLCRLTAPRGETSSLLPYPWHRWGLFWKSHPLYLGRKRRLRSPTIRVVSHTTIHQRTSANSDGIFPENCIWKLISWI